MLGAKTRHHSTVETLPPNVVQEVDGLITQGQSYRAIAADLEARGYKVSKSALARYGKRLLARVKQMQTMREIAQALTGETCGLDLEEAAMRVALTRLVHHLLVPGDEAEVKNLLKILTVLPRLQSAAVQREQWKVKHPKRTGSGIRDERKGLSDEMVNEIRCKILGVIPRQVEYAQSELDVNDFG